MKSPPETMWTYALAFLSAVMVPTLILSSLAGIIDGSTIFIIVLVFGMMYASFLVFVLALPTFLVFQRLGLVNLWTSVIAGFVIGCVPTAILPTSVILFNTDIAAALEMGVLGAIGGLVFWLVIRHTIEDAPTAPPNDLEP